MEIQSYIKPELLILVAVIYVIGMMLKNSKAIKNKYIPATLGGVGVILAMMYVIAVEGISMMSIFTGVTQGIIIAGVAVYANQLIKQGSKGD